MQSWLPDAKIKTLKVRADLMAPAGVGCMLGAMAAKPKVRKVHQRQQKTKLGALEKPQEVKRIDTEQKQVCCARLSPADC